MLVQIVAADKCVGQQMKKLETQCERLNLEVAGTGAEDETVKSAMREACATLRAELDTYQRVPQRRFFYILNQPVNTVLKTMLTLVGSQGGGYAWHFIQQARFGDDDDGSSGDICERFLEREGC